MLTPPRGNTHSTPASDVLGSLSTKKWTGTAENPRFRTRVNNLLKPKYNISKRTKLTKMPDKTTNEDWFKNASAFQTQITRDKRENTLHPGKNSSAVRNDKNDETWSHLKNSNPVQNNKMDTSETTPSISAPSTASASYNIPTHNRFGILTPSDQATQIAEKTPPADQTTAKKMPPIIIKTKIADIQKFNKEVKDLVKVDYQVRYLKNSINITTFCKEDYNTLKEEFAKSGMEFYSFTPKDDLEKKVVVKVAPNMDTERIMATIKAKNIEVRNCIPMKSRKTGETSASYLISTEKGIKLQDFKAITNIDNFHTKWEHYAKPTKTTLCFNCQRPGHGARNCNYQPRCVKCTDPHPTKECKITKKPGSRVTCCNCLGPHTANYRGCPTMVSYLENKTPINSATHKKQNTIKTSNENFNINTQHFPALNKTQNSPQETPVSNSSSYRNALTNNNSNQLNDFQTLQNELNELNSICNINYLINLIRTFKTQIAGCKNDLDIINVMLNLFNKNP